MEDDPEQVLAGELLKLNERIRTHMEKTQGLDSSNRSRAPRQEHAATLQEGPESQPSG